MLILINKKRKGGGGKGKENEDRTDSLDLQSICKSTRPSCHCITDNI